MDDTADHPQVAIATKSKTPRWTLMSNYEDKIKDQDWTVHKLRNT